jgi:hypothetical protein
MAHLRIARWWHIYKLYETLATLPSVPDKEREERERKKTKVKKIPANYSQSTRINSGIVDYPRSNLD